MLSINSGEDLVITGIRTGVMVVVAVEEVAEAVSTATILTDGEVVDDLKSFQPSSDHETDAVAVGCQFSDEVVAVQPSTSPLRTADLGTGDPVTPVMATAATMMLQKGAMVFNIEVCSFGWLLCLSWVYQLVIVLFPNGKDWE